MTAANVITLPPTNREETIKRLAETLRFFQIGKPVNVKMTIARPERTIPQLRYLRGVAYAILATQFGYEPEEISEFLCGEYWGWKTKKLPGGRTSQVPMRTTTEDEDGNRDVIDGQVFWDYVEWIQRKAARQGVVIPDPDPNYKIARAA